MDFFAATAQVRLWPVPTALTARWFRRFRGLEQTSGRSVENHAPDPRTWLAGPHTISRGAESPVKITYIIVPLHAFANSAIVSFSNASAFFTLSR